LVPDPDALFAEFQSRGLAFHETFADTEDGLRAFELKDHDGYVLCFGKPLRLSESQIYGDKIRELS